MQPTHQNLQRVFQQAFCVGDIARTLISFDDTTSAAHAKTVLIAKGEDFAGIRTNGLVAGYVTTGDLVGGSCGEVKRVLDDGSLVSETLSLAALVLRLSKQAPVFVTAVGQVCGVVGREDFLQPPGRMWLFGMITLLELRFRRMIEEHCPAESWKSYLSEGRLQKAEALLAERSRCGRRVALEDCLQFSDKTTILARVERLRTLTRFTSKRQIEDVGRRLEMLRNGLAHSQDIVADDWDTIVALAEHLDAVLQDRSERRETIDSR